MHVSTGLPPHPTMETLIVKKVVFSDIQMQSVYSDKGVRALIAGHCYSKPGLSLWSPIQVLTEVAVAQLQ